MLLRRIEYELRVAETGYEWLEKPFQPVNERNEIRVGSLLCERYSDSSHTSRKIATTEARKILRDFIWTEPTAESMLSFARKYGCLGGYLETRLQQLDSNGAPAGPVVMAELQLSWQKEVTFARKTATLWESSKRELVHERIAARLERAGVLLKAH